eukprot:scaffold14307_cov32-Tisochrysis_lutea.AAC.3
MHAPIPLSLYEPGAHSSHTPGSDPTRCCPRSHWPVPSLSIAMNIWRTGSYEYGKAKPAKSPRMASGDRGVSRSRGTAMICCISRGT